MKRKYRFIFEKFTFEEYLMQFMKSDMKIIKNGDSIAFQSLTDIEFDAKFNEISFIIRTKKP